MVNDFQKFFRVVCGLAVVCVAVAAHLVVFPASAAAQSRFSIGPFASVSSTKQIKPNGNKTASEETVTQRVTYGVRAGFGLFSVFGLDIKIGVNDVDRTKKSSAMRDEFEEIDIEKDANVNTADQGAEYRYQESQKLGTAKLTFNPRLFSALWLKVGAGVRARKRDIVITQKNAMNESEAVAPENERTVISDPIKYHAVGSAGFGFRLLRSFTGSIEYDFYFLKFPEVEPHEQEVSVSFGVSI